MKYFVFFGTVLLVFVLGILGIGWITNQFENNDILLLVRIVLAFGFGLWLGTVSEKVFFLLRERD